MAKVMITGIAGGFGRLTALALLEKGQVVAGSVRSRQGRNAGTVGELEAAGARIVEMDVTETASTEAGVAEANAALGGLDVLFNNAGIGSYGIQELMSPEDMARIFDVNVMGVQIVMRAALPHLGAQGFGIESCIIEPGAMPTAFFDAMVAPNDPAREAEYGAFAQVPGSSGTRPARPETACASAPVRMRNACWATARHRMTAPSSVASSASCVLD